METNLHMVSKMTAIGYLLHKYRDKSCEKTVIAMDGSSSSFKDRQALVAFSDYYNLSALTCAVCASSSGKISGLKEK
ncbi:MAG: hypothetical protein NT004_02990 [Bacteroidetes bacterium]|nr:hypothetical protein [Bacteroidota bacterium]